jgi:hypothetical protein
LLIAKFAVCRVVDESLRTEPGLIVRELRKEVCEMSTTVTKHVKKLNTVDRFSIDTEWLFGLPGEAAQLEIRELSRQLKLAWNQFPGYC